MKGIPIKFRAKDLKSGEFVYGLINIDGDGVQRFIYDYHTDTNYLVDENTISQLVGYDAKGKEIYEDDSLESSTFDYAVLIPAHKVLNQFTGKYDLKGLSPDDVAAWNIRLKG